MSDAPLGLALRASGPLAPLQRCALRLAELSGWRRAGMAMMLGALAALALPPIDMTPLLVVAFSGLVWLADGATGRRAAFALGWNFGFGFFLVGLYWITAALFVDIAQFWWLVPFAVAAVHSSWGCGPLDLAVTQQADLLCWMARRWPSFTGGFAMPWRSLFEHRSVYRQRRLIALSTKC